jgi:hypothetical protein
MRFKESVAINSGLLALGNVRAWRRGRLADVRCLRGGRCVA